VGDPESDTLRSQCLVRIADELQRYIQSSNRRASNPCPYEIVGSRLKKLRPLFGSVILDRERVIHELATCPEEYGRCRDEEISGCLEKEFNGVLEWGLGKVLWTVVRRQSELEQHLSPSQPAKAKLLKMFVLRGRCKDIDKHLAADLRWALLQSSFDWTFRQAVKDPQFPANLLRLALANAQELVRKPMPSETDPLVELVRSLATIYQSASGRPATVGSVGNKNGMSLFEAFGLPIVRLVRKHTEIDSFRHAFRAVKEESAKRESELIVETIL
jgi:hypothetical protein